MRRAHPFLLGIVTCLLLAGPAAADQPQMERFTQHEIGILDPYLSGLCGVDVFLNFTGHFTIRTFSDADGNPTHEVNNYANKIRVYTASSSISLVDVGADRITYNSDGSITQVIIGNVQSIQVPGLGQVWANVGQTTVLITFPEGPDGDPVFEITNEIGQHSETLQETVICDVLAP